MTDYAYMDLDTTPVNRMVTGGVCLCTCIFKHVRLRRKIVIDWKLSLDSIHNIGEY